MRFLFVHQSFPGQYLHILRHLAQQGGHEIVFISEPGNQVMDGVRRAIYRLPPFVQDGVHPQARDLDQAMRRAELVARTAAQLKGLGFVPDLIIGHHGWGELLNLVDVYPAVPILGYFEFWYRRDGQDIGFDPEHPVDPSHLPRVRAMNTANLAALALDQHGQTPTRWQFNRYPAWARGGIRRLTEGARLDQCRPDTAARGAPLAFGDFHILPEHRLVTYVARNLEPYRGFHTMMRTLPALLRARPDLRVVLVGGDGVSYGTRPPVGTWAEVMQRELAGRYDASRVLLPGQIPYLQYLRLLQRSDAHVYLTYPFVVSWSLREALACGCPVIAGDVDSVREFIRPGRNGLLAPPLDPAALADTVLDVLERPALSDRLRHGARAYAQRHLDIRLHLEAFTQRISEITGQALPPPAPHPG